MSTEYKTRCDTCNKIKTTEEEVWVDFELWFNENSNKKWKKRRKNSFDWDKDYCSKACYAKGMWKMNHEIQKFLEKFFDNID